MSFRQTGEHHVRVQPIGSSVYLEPGDRTIVSYLQCQSCGQVWTRCHDPGPGAWRYAAIGPHLHDAR